VLLTTRKMSWDKRSFKSFESSEPIASQNDSLFRSVRNNTLVLVGVGQPCWSE